MEEAAIRTDLYTLPVRVLPRLGHMQLESGGGVEIRDAQAVAIES